MILRVAFFVLMAIALVGFGVVAWVSFRPPPPPPPPVTHTAPVATPTAPPPPVKVLVVAHSIAAGSMLKPDDFVARSVPAPGVPGAIPADAADAVRGLAGALAKRALAVGEQIRDDDIVRASDHGFMAAALQPGTRAVTLVVDAASGSAGLLWPGDRVDVTLTVTRSEANLPAANRVAAKTILTNIRVIAIDQQLVQGVAPTAGEGQSRTVTLEVKPDDVQLVSIAKQMGRLSLSVRSVGGDETAGPQGEPISADELIKWINGGAPPAAPSRTIHIQGPGDSKEVKF